MALFDQKDGEKDEGDFSEELRELILSLGNNDCKVRKNAAIRLKKIGKPAILILLKSLDSDNTMIRTGAAEILGTYGEAALPTLLRLVTTGKERVRDGAARAIGYNGKDALKQLKELLSDENFRARRGAVMSLGYFTRPGTEIKELLITALDDKNEEVRTQAVISLENIGWIPKKREYQALFYIVNGDYDSVVKLGTVVLPVLKREINTKDKAKKLKITGILPRINEDEALFILINLLDDNDKNIRQKAVEAVGETGDNRLQPYLVKKLKDPDFDVRREAAWALDRINWRPDESEDKARYLLIQEKWGDLLQMKEVAAPVLIESLKDKNSNVSLKSTEILRAMGNIGYTAINEALKSEDQELKIAASKAAALIKKKNSEAGKPKAYKSKKTPDEEVEEEIRHHKEAMSLRDSKSEEFWRELMQKSGLDKKRTLRFSKALSDESEIVRETAVESLKSAGDPGIECIIALLSDKKKRVRIAATESLGDLQAKQAAPPLVKLTKTKDIDLRIKAIQSLGMIKEPQSLPDLIKLFPDKNKTIRKEASCTVGKFGAVALPLLHKTYLEPEKLVRISALRAVSLINDPQSISLSVRMLNDSDSDVRNCAIRALKFLSKNIFNSLIDESQRILIQGTFMEKKGIIATLSGINELRAKKVIAVFESDENKEVRDDAAAALRELQPQNKVKPENSLRIKNKQKRTSMGISEEQKRIISDLKSDDNTVRMKAAEKVFLIGDEMIAPLIKSLNHENPAYQNFVAEILTGLGDRAIDELIKILKTGTPGLKLIAAQNLGKIPDEITIDALCYALYHEPDTIVRTIATESLGFLGDSRSVDALIYTANEDNKTLRRAAIRSLGYIGNKKAIKTLIDAYRDEDPQIWQIATEALGKCGNEGIEALKSALISGDHSSPRERIAQALNELNWVPEKETSTIYYLIGKKEWNELEKIGNPAIGPLSKVITDDDIDTRLNAINVLAKIGSEEAIISLSQALCDKSPMVRKKAEMAILKTGSPAIPVLEKIVSNTRDPTERTFTMSILRKINELDYSASE